MAKSDLTGVTEITKQILKTMGKYHNAVDYASEELSNIKKTIESLKNESKKITEKQQKELLEAQEKLKVLSAQQKEKLEDLKKAYERTRKSVVHQLMSTRSVSEAYQNKIDAILNKKTVETFKMSKFMWDEQEQTRNAVRNLITPVFGDLVSAFDTTIDVLKNFKTIATGVGKFIRYIVNIREITTLSKGVRRTKELEDKESLSKFERDEYKKYADFITQKEIEKAAKITEISRNISGIRDLIKQGQESDLAKDEQEEKFNRALLAKKDGEKINIIEKQVDSASGILTQKSEKKEKSGFVQTLVEMAGSFLVRNLGKILGIGGGLLAGLKMFGGKIMSTIPFLKYLKGPGALKLAKGAGGFGLGLLGLGMELGGEYLYDKGHKKIGGTMMVGGSTLSGAALGATIGSLIPGVGTVIGGTIGGIAGLGFGLWKVMKKSKENVEKLEKEATVVQKAINSTHTQGKMLDEIAKAEGTYGKGDYNAIFGYDKYLTAEMKNKLAQAGGLSNMTLGELRQFQEQLLKQTGDFNTSAVGRYQIVGKTLFGREGGRYGKGGLYAKLGLTDDMKFTPELQDKLARAIIEEQLARSGGDINRYRRLLAQQWQGLETRGISSELDRNMMMQVAEMRNIYEKSRLAFVEDKKDMSDTMTEAVKKGVELAFKDNKINVNVMTQGQTPATNYIALNTYNQATG
jgi:hypothetical protein